MFDGTVAENIARFGELDPEKVIQAAQRAGMHELILRLPEGYDTPLGVGGSALSGGQKQRIGLARALYGDPALVVLDEPNSNLDEAGERALSETIGELTARGCTTILITHRTASLDAVQKIMILAEGTVRAYGPRTEILTAMRALAVPSPVAAASRAAPRKGLAALHRVPDKKDIHLDA
ncbi:hypothetical protein GCM10011496_05300 [Polaromonas eurypsychrophila]|uniref:ABC transporter domain-containing protein n=1 Tax=Polaromonas eurypsychrophila TaxID=1614635 RepID=A0A916S905_9BURK|nr:hypothetical protein GCM10011496_05300 [Polaromonas eurypsychrophila]